jgi:hypothetical protein
MSMCLLQFSFRGTQPACPGVTVGTQYSATITLVHISVRVTYGATMALDNIGATMTYMM